MVEHTAGAIDRFADRLSAELDGIEEKVAGSNSGDERQRLSKVRKSALRLHRHLSGLRSAFRRMEVDTDDELNPTLHLSIGRLLQRLDGLDHDILAVRERGFLLQEEVSLKIAEETNRNLYVLAILSAMLLPPTLVTGIYGMNVKGIPLAEGEDGFIGVAVVLGIASLITLFALWRLKVLKS
jgi:zinc transporter